MNFVADVIRTTSGYLQWVARVCQGGRAINIWYQSYSAIGFDPRWRYYEETLQKHVAKVARADTRIDIHGVEKMPPKMLYSSYFQYLHIAQVIEKALQAEREGYDAFVLAGMRDFAYSELKDVLDIPIAFIAESSFHIACLLAAKFSVINTTEVSMQASAALVKRYGLQERNVPGVHIGISLLELVEAFQKEPKGVINKFTEAARQVIAQGAGILIPGFGGLSVFLAEQGVKEVDGIPILDNQAAVIKTAEILVDLKKLGISRSKKIPYHPSKEELAATRKLYGVE